MSNLIEVFSELGRRLINPTDELQEIIDTERQYNAWFTPENVAMAIKAIGETLNPNSLEKWLGRYDLTGNKKGKKVGLILAGNIPLVGFHDVLCVLITGNTAMIKASSQDSRLIRHVLKMLVDIDDSFKHQYQFVERLENFDAVIATGSNNSSRYFDYYFGKVPNIIRKNRNSLALLAGSETTEQLMVLGHDIFDYFGLGCRNVSKLLVPKGYSFNFFFESIEVFQPVINHHKYNNNYGYNKSIYLVNGDKHFDNGFLLLKEDERLASPLAVLFYEYYDNLAAVQHMLNEQSDNIQCVAGPSSLNLRNQVVDFGKSQQPDLWDYADGLDTMEFLLKIDNA